jgi:mannitol/fructose-specific phosphotransferase system IIA component (Ntr-type)
MLLKKLLDAKHVLIFDSFTDTNEFFENITGQLEQLKIIENKLFIKRLFVKRENLQSTAIGNGFAAPHIYSKEFQNFYLFVSLFKEGMEFKAPDKKPVYLAFKILSDERHVDKHLKILQKIALIANTPDSFKKIQQLKTKQDVIDFILKTEQALDSNQ